MSDDRLNKIVSLAKRRGFVYQGSEIYGGLAGTWDFGPYGSELKRNIENAWWRMFVSECGDIYGMDATLLMNRRVWEASGHADGFSDPFVECAECKQRFRKDKVGGECPECGGAFGAFGDFNTMFETRVGAGENVHRTFLRPETAQGMFVNFKNVVDSLHPKLPFGMAQIGKAFRNEIAPRDFLFRTREFSQMEIEYFVREREWKRAFTRWQKEMRRWMERIGLSPEHIHEIEVPKDERAHYSKRTIDFEYDFPHGQDELYGLAYRGDFDLRNHNLSFTDDDGETFTPHVIEPTFGIERTVLAVLAEAYTEDELNGEKRTYLKFVPELAPVKVAVFPLLRNKPELVKKAQSIYTRLCKKIPQTAWDDNGNIGKRYRRQDEIGTPYCVTIDFQTLEDGTVTLRDRDTGGQERVAVKELTKRIVRNIQ